MKRKLALLLSVLLTISLVGVYGVTIGGSGGHVVNFSAVGDGSISASVNGTDISTGDTVTGAALLTVVFVAVPNDPGADVEWTVNGNPPAPAALCSYGLTLTHEFTAYEGDSATTLNVVVTFDLECDNGGIGYIPGPGLGGGGAGSRPTTSLPSPTRPRDEPRTAETTVTLGDTSIDVQRSGSRVDFNLTASDARDIINETAGNTVVLDVSGATGFAGVIEARMPRAALRRFADAGMAVEINMAQGSVVLSSEALNSILSQSTAPNVSVSIATPSRGLLTARQRNAVRQDYTISRVRIRVGTINIYEFGGAVTVTLPVAQGQTSVFRLADSGVMTTQPATPNAAAQTVTFTTNQSAIFVVR